MALVRRWLVGSDGLNEDRSIRGGLDADAAGDAAPHTELSSAARVRRLFVKFGNVRLHRENMDPLVWRGRTVASRERVLSSLGRWVGLDWYVRAIKRRTREG